MKLRFFVVALALVLGLLEIPASSAVTSKLTMSLKQTPSASEALITFYGTLSPAQSSINVFIDINADGIWKQTRFKSKTTKAGSWKIEALATALNARVQYRARTVVAGKKLYSRPRTITIKQTPEISEADPALIITAAGPGGRIHGADISRWQHPSDKTIDFVKMYEAGLRFVMIKASDTREDADQLSLKYLVMDHSAAQAAGIYTGFYHYAI